MPRGSRPGERRGGRRAGTPNKATRDIKAAAQLHTAKMLAVLVGIANENEAPPQARVTAAKTVIEFGHGKAPQAITGEGGGPLRLTRVIHEEADASGG